MMACFPSQTDKELHTDLKRIALIQKSYNIFSVIYCLYRMSIYQRFYKELKDQGLIVKPITPVFITRSGQKVCKTDSLNFSYEDNDAYHILRIHNKGNEIGSAVAKLNLYGQKSRLNNGRSNFIYHINNFLFETQLLYLKKVKNSRKSSLIKKEALKFYAERVADISCYLYKNKKV